MTEESVKKTALATEYWNIRRKQIEKIRGSLTNAQRNFLFYPEDGTVRLDAALQSAMKDPSTVPSEYIALHLDWMFGEAIPSYDREVVLYFADRLRDYPYSDSWSRRTFRSPDQGDYVEKLKRVIRAHVNPVVDAPAEAVLSGEIPEGGFGGQMPEGFEPGQMPGGGRGGRDFGQTNVENAVTEFEIKEGQNLIEVKAIIDEQTLAEIQDADAIVDQEEEMQELIDFEKLLEESNDKIIKDEKRKSLLKKVRDGLLRMGKVIVKGAIAAGAVVGSGVYSGNCRSRYRL